jgi:hypothetical protein
MPPIVDGLDTGSAVEDTGIIRNEAAAKRTRIARIFLAISSLVSSLMVSFAEW